MQKELVKLGEAGVGIQLRPIVDPHLAAAEAKHDAPQPGSQGDGADRAITGADLQPG